MQTVRHGPRLGTLDGDRTGAGMLIVREPGKGVHTNFIHSVREDNGGVYFYPQFPRMVLGSDRKGVIRIRLERRGTNDMTWWGSNRRVRKRDFLRRGYPKHGIETCVCFNGSGITSIGITFAVSHGLWSDLKHFRVPQPLTSVHLDGGGTVLRMKGNADLNRPKALDYFGGP